MKKSTACVILFIIVIGALCLRLFNLFTYDLWFDEVITSKFSSDNLKSMAHANNTSPLGYFFANTIKDPHSTLFYTVVYGYSFLFGGGKALRILSVFFSICSLGIFYKTARIFFNRHKSLFACFLMAVSPFHIWYAQEVRGYTMACFFTLLLVYFYMRALGTNRILYWAAFTIASIIALYASYYVAFLLIGLGIIVLFHYDRRCIGRWLIAVSIIAASFIPLVPIFFIQLKGVMKSFWLPPPPFFAIPLTLVIYCLGYSANLFSLIAGFVIGTFLVLYGTYASFRNDRKTISSILLLSIFSLVVTYVISLTITPIYIPRQLFIFSPFCYLLVTNGIYAIKKSTIRLFFMLGIVLLITISLINMNHNFMLSFKGKRADYYGGVHPRKQYAPVLEHMRHVMRENDLVAVTDLQASVIVRGYFETWKGKKLPSPLTFLLYPNYVTHFTKSGMGLHALINKQFLKQQRNRNIKTLERSKRKAVPKDYQRRLKRVHGSVYPAKGSPSVDNLDLFWFYGTKEEPHGVLEKALLEERDFERIWVITLLWGDDVPMMLNSHLVNEYFEKNFKRVSGKRKDGVSVVLYTTKGEQGEDKT